MKVRHWSGAENELTVSKLISYEVAAATSERGALEDLAKKVEVLTAILASLVEFVGNDAAKHILSAVGEFHKPTEVEAILDDEEL